MIGKHIPYATNAVGCYSNAALHNHLIQKSLNSDAAIPIEFVFDFLKHIFIPTCRGENSKIMSMVSPVNAWGMLGKGRMAIYPG